MVGNILPKNPMEKARYTILSVLFGGRWYPDSSHMEVGDFVMSSFSSLFRYPISQPLSPLLISLSFELMMDRARFYGIQSSRLVLKKMLLLHLRSCISMECVMGTSEL